MIANPPRTRLAWLFAGCAVAVAASGPAPAQPAPSRGSAKTPLEVYQASCLECHGADGRGDLVRDVMPSIPDFTSEPWHARRGDAELARSILEGKGRSMPRMARKLGTLDVSRLVAFVRAFRGGTQVVPEPEEAEEPGPSPAQTDAPERPAPQPARTDAPAIRAGSQVFRRLCAMCHGPDGRGETARATTPAIPDFTRREWQTTRRDAQLAVSILDGKGTGMPAFRNKLTDAERRDLVTFVRAFVPGFQRASDAGQDEFDARFQRLRNECEELGRQVRALSRPARRL